MKAIRANHFDRNLSSLLALLLGLVLLSGTTAHAQKGGIPEQIAALQQTVADLTQQVQVANAAAANAQSKANLALANVSALQSTVNSLADKLRFVSVVGTEMYVTGANLNIRDGSGATSGTIGEPYRAKPTGLGNLIIGYNENALSPCGYCLPQPVRPRTGSHNLILGADNGYSSTGGIVVGFANSISSPYSVITGGSFNTASGIFSAISGGQLNTVTSEAASVSGGIQGTASGRFSSVSGGNKNTASNESDSVSGGSGNTASGTVSSISGGAGNTVSAQSSSISGGGFVQVNTQFTWAAGSLHNP